MSSHLESVMELAGFIPRKWECFEDCCHGDNFVLSFSHVCGSVSKAKEINTFLFYEGMIHRLHLRNGGRIHFPTHVGAIL